MCGGCLLFTNNSMKSKLLIAAVLLLLSTTSYAQFTNTRSSIDNGDRNTIYLQWNPSSYGLEVLSGSFTGFSAGYNLAFSLSQSIPLYLEAGIGVQYSFWDGDLWLTHKGETVYIYKDSKIKVLSAKVPVSLMYKFDIPNSIISIVPKAGLDMRFNILGKLKNDDIEKSLNLFDQDDMKKDDWTWNRFQIGWHVGIDFIFNNKFLVGASYGTDFNDIAKDKNVRTGSITLGYCY